MSDNAYAEAVNAYYQRDGMFVDSDTELLDNSGRFFKKIKDERIVPANDMNALIGFTLGRMKKTGSEIVRGNTEISPIKDGKTDACRYCDYADICKVRDCDARRLTDAPDNFYREES